MMRSLYTAASGMMAQKLNIDNVSRNLANVGSQGYKATNVNFSDLVYASKGFAQVGLGVRADSVQTSFAAGKPQLTNGKLHAYLSDPRAFFVVKLEDNTSAFIRVGAFTLMYDEIKKKNKLVTRGGIETGIEFSTDVTDIEIKADGKVTGTSIKEGKEVELGQLKLAKFLNPSDSLKAIGTDLYVLSGSAGETKESNPGEDGLPTLATGYLESSNVNVIEGMMDIMAAQQMFQMNQKVAQVADEMMKMANQIKRA
ncbi:MAG: flagellar hook-basal body complex protein [Armatimonadota bacterium]